MLLSKGTENIFQGECQPLTTARTIAFVSKIIFLMKLKVKCTVAGVLYGMFFMEKLYPFKWVFITPLSRRNPINFFESSGKMQLV